MEKERRSHSRFHGIAKLLQAIALIAACSWWGAAPRTAGADEPRAVEGPPALGTVYGQVWLHDMHPRFITIPEAFISVSAPWSHILVGDYYQSLLDDVLLLHEDLRLAELVILEENGTIASYLPLRVQRPTAVWPDDDPPVQVLPGRFKPAPQGFIVRTQSGRLLHLELNSFERPPAAEGHKQAVTFSVVDTLIPRQWGTIDPGLSFLTAAHLDGDPYHELVFHNPSTSMLSLVFFDSGAGFKVVQAPHRCRPESLAHLLSARFDPAAGRILYCIDKTAGEWKLRSAVGEGDPAGPALLPGEGRTLLLAEDLDEDGVDELVVSSGDNGIAVYRREGSAFTRHEVPGDRLTPSTGQVVRIAPQKPAELWVEDREAIWHRLSFEGNALKKREAIAAPKELRSPMVLRGRFRTPDRESIILFDRAAAYWAISNVENLLHASQVRISTEEGFSGFSDAEGWFRLEHLTPGRYSFSASQLGFAFRPRRSEIELRPSSPHYLEFVAELNTAPRPEGPAVCVGFAPDRLQWGRLSPRDRRHLRCPAGHAVYASDDSTEPYSLDCCPLPASDILLGEVEYAEHTCPDGMIAAGPTRSTTFLGAPSYVMRCVKINDKRYQLGPPRPGVQWGDGLRERGAKRITRQDIPMAIRFGVGRQALGEFQDDGCIGDPPGSLLVSRTSKYCDDTRFRELQYRGAEGDPPQGTPVKMFPDCLDISSPFDPAPSCIPRP